MTRPFNRGDEVIYVHRDSNFNVSAHKAIVVRKQFSSPMNDKIIMLSIEIRFEDGEIRYTSGGSLHHLADYTAYRLRIGLGATDQ